MAQRIYLSAAKLSQVFSAFKMNAAKKSLALAARILEIIREKSLLTFFKVQQMLTN